jgi:hypothetical protein
VPFLVNRPLGEEHFQAFASQERADLFGDVIIEVPAGYENVIFHFSSGFIEVIFAKVNKKLNNHSFIAWKNDISGTIFAQ